MSNHLSSANDLRQLPGSAQIPRILTMGERSQRYRVVFDMGGQMSRLPIDVVLDIFSRLAIKDLKQCMRVKRSWCLAICSQYFAKLHHQKSDFRSTHIASFILQDLNVKHKRNLYDLYLVEFECFNDDGKFFYDVIPLRSMFKNLNAQYELVGSCNGLLCLSETSLSDPIYICNPVIGEYMTLPLATEETDLDIISGFGFDEEKGAYKVVRMMYVLNKHVYLQTAEDLEAEIYTIGSKSWRKIGSVPYPPRGDRPGVFLNGVIYWMVDKTLSPNEPCGIVCFNVASEEFSLMPPPPGYASSDIDIDDDFENLMVKVVRGCLCFIDRRGDEMVVWLMKQDGLKQSWAKEDNLDNLFGEIGILECLPEIPTRYDICTHVGSLVAYKDSRENAARGERYDTFEKWSRNLCVIPSTKKARLVVPADSSLLKTAIYNNAYARVPAPDGSGNQHLIRYDKLYDYEERAEAKRAAANRNGAAPSTAPGA